jgi:hypothetical protein
MLVWKERGEGLYCWGCEDCRFIVQEPRLQESIGEYVATIRNAFDAHRCEDYARERRRPSSALLVVKKGGESSSKHVAPRFLVK